MRTVALTAMLMAILTFVSKCFGFVREMVMANYFGTTYVTDAYVMAFSILSVLFGGLIAAISTAYIPIFSKITENEGKAEADRITSRIINILLVLTISISFIGILLSDQIISIFASGFSGETAKLSSYFVKVLFSYLIFSSTTGILESYLQYKGIFLPQIISGYLISICTIIAIVISAYTSYYYIAFGILIGYALRFIAMLIITKRRDYKYTCIIKSDENTKQIIRMAIPTFISSYMLYINQFIDKTLASNLTEGSISALNYAALLNSMIIGVAITILSTIIYPKLSQANSTGQYDRFNYMASTGLNIVIIIALPCSLGAMLYSDQVVQIVYQRGAFDAIATTMTSSAFFFYSMGLLFMSVNDLMIRVYYSMHDMKNPMIFSGISVIINIVLCLLLVRVMAHNGLALATSIAAFCNTGMLFYGLRRRYSNIKLLQSKNTLIRIIAASIISVAASYLFYKFVIIWLSDVIFMRTIQLFLSVVVACVIYYILLILFKINEVRLIKEIFHRQKV